MPVRDFPVRPDLEQLRHQAKDLLRALRRSAPEALALVREHAPRLDPAAAKLADAQHALARSYGLASWPRLVLACRMTDALWRDDLAAVEALLDAHPELLVEGARGVRDSWGPPLSYAANLGRERLVVRLLERGAGDLQHAFERACLQGQLATARRLRAQGARLERGLVMGPCETLNADGLAFLLELGAEPCDAHGDRLAPVALVLQTYSRRPEGKHRCLELLERAGTPLPDTAPMAVHRGCLARLERHLARDPGLLARTFTHAEIYPPELGCAADESLALHGTPLAGGTLLHLCVDLDELELARALLAHGADPDARAALDADGFGGHTPLFGCVVSQPWRVGQRRDDAFARLLLAAGADPSARASLRKRLRFVADETEHVYRDVTPRTWGERFHDQAWVARPVLELLAARGAE
ncbi:MAG TPA: ankyrin repeat domain-containing protein [Planctomycetota bacterium]